MFSNKSSKKPAAATPKTSFNINNNIAVLHLDDGKANAVGYHTLIDINDAISAAESEARSLLITGREGCFSAGFDLKVVRSGSDAARDLVEAGARTVMRLYGASVPVVVACTGHSLAFGAIMLLATDLRIGADIEAKIGLNEVAIGMPLPVFAVELSRDRLSPGHFTRATALANLYSPADAIAAGYLDEVVAASDLVSVATERAQLLAKHLTPQGFAVTRQNARHATINHILSTLEDDLSSFAIQS